MSRHLHRSLLVATVLAGLVLRVWDINHDRGMGAHPDERSITSTYAVSLRLPDSWDDFRNPRRSRLNPLWDVDNQQERHFAYGHFPLYLGVAMGELLQRLAVPARYLSAPADAVRIMQSAADDWTSIAVAGRLTMALLDTLTIVLVYWVGRLVYGRGAGLIAAAFLAFTAQAIQLSHFFAMDPASTTFIVLAVLGGVMTVREGSWRAAVVCGLGAGLAISSKMSALPVLAVPVVAGLLGAHHLRCSTLERDTSQPSPLDDCEFSAGLALDRRARFRVLLGIPLAIFVAVVAFGVTSPYAILDARTFVAATLVDQGRIVRGLADVPFTRQYRNTTPYLYFVQQQVQWGMWWPLALVCMLGTLVAARRLCLTLVRLLHSPSSALARTHAAELVVWAWVIPYFALTGAFYAKFNRYISPLLPFAALLGAGLVWSLWRAGAAKQPYAAARRAAAVLLCATGLGGGAFWSLAYVNGVYNQPHPWITAAYWMKEHVPSRAVVLSEAWDDPLPFGSFGDPEVDRYAGELAPHRSSWGPFEDDTPEKYRVLKEKLAGADYVVYASKRVWDSVDEWPERYPMTNLYYRSMFDGSLGFELVFAPETYPRLLGARFPDRTADESWSLYDHPQPLIFRKIRQLSGAELDAKFAPSGIGGPVRED